MRRLFPWMGMFVLLAGVCAGAEDWTERDKLLGSWQLEGTSNGSPATEWTFATSGYDLQVTEVDGDKMVAKFKCSISGSNCEIKSSGKKATLSMWYLGAKLVQMETKGSEVVKRRFSVLAPGDIMEMEVIPVVPNGKTETFRFRRMPTSAKSK